MADREFSERKQEFYRRIVKLFQTHSKIFIVEATNVGSSQFQQIRMALRGKATILMGKKTLIKKVIKGLTAKIPALEALSAHVHHNVGLVFVSGDLADVKSILVANKVSAPARQGGVAQCEVIIPAQNTGAEPTKTSFFQALDIPTKITKGTVEITKDVTILKKGDKVGNSEAALLAMLNMRPFFYGLSVSTVYDNGSIYSADVLDITEDDLVKKFQAAAANVVALSLGSGFSTEASLPYAFSDAFKNVLSLGLGLDGVTFDALEAYKSASKNAPAAVAAPAAAASSSAAPAASVKAPEPVEEEEEGGFGDLFG